MSVSNGHSRNVSGAAVNTDAETEKCCCYDSFSSLETLQIVKMATPTALHNGDESGDESTSSGDVKGTFY